MEILKRLLLSARRRPGELEEIIDGSIALESVLLEGERVAFAKQTERAS